MHELMVKYLNTAAFKFFVCLLVGFAAGYAAHKTYHRKAKKQEIEAITILRRRAIRNAVKSGQTEYSFTSKFSPPISQR